MTCVYDHERACKCLWIHKMLTISGSITGEIVICDKVKKGLKSYDYPIDEKKFYDYLTSIYDKNSSQARNSRGVP